MMGAEHASLHRARRVLWVGDWRGRAGEVVDSVDGLGEQQGIADIVLDEPEIRMIREWTNIGDTTSIEVVDADDAFPLLNQTITQVRADKTRASRHQHGDRFSCTPHLG